MSVQNRSMPYDCLKSVLQHMDPNKRASLASRCPSIKTTDSFLPQKIDSIHLEPYSITINDTTYQLGVIQQYPQGVVVPESVVKRNKEGGVQYDMDKFGLRIDTSEFAPGDSNVSADTPKTEMGVQLLEQDHLKSLTQRLEKTLKMIERIQKFPKRASNLKQVVQTMAELEAQILPYQLRQKSNGKDIPFTNFLQLTVSTSGPDGQKVQSTEVLEYNQNLGTAMKYLINRLLKKPMIHVNTLRITPSIPAENCCFWLPADVELTVDHLKIDNDPAKVVEAFGEFFNNSPLKSIEFQPCEGVNYESPIVSTADKLIIKQSDCYTCYDKIRHRRVHFDFCAEYYDFVELLNDWQANGAPIGTHYSSYTDPEYGSYWYQFLDGQIVPGFGCKSFPDRMILPLANKTQLELYIEDISDHPHPMVLHLEVKPKL